MGGFVVPSSGWFFKLPGIHHETICHVCRGSVFECAPVYVQPGGAGGGGGFGSRRGGGGAGPGLGGAAGAVEDGGIAIAGTNLPWPKRAPVDEPTGIVVLVRAAGGVADERWIPVFM